MPKADYYLAAKQQGTAVPSGYAAALGAVATAEARQTREWAKLAPVLAAHSKEGRALYHQLSEARTEFNLSCDGDRTAVVATAEALDAWEKEGVLLDEELEAMMQPFDRALGRAQFMLWAMGVSNG